MLKKYLYFAAAVICMISCTKEPDRKSDSFFCSIKDDFNHVVWKFGDIISVFNYESSNKIFAYSGEDGLSYGNFIFQSGEDSDVSLPYNFAVFPWAESNEATKEGDLYLDLPDHQELSSYRPPMVAWSEDNSFVFKHLCGALVLRIYGGGQLASLTLTGKRDEALAGRAIVSRAQDDGVTMSFTAQKSSSVTLQCSPAITLGEAADKPSELRLLLPETTFGEGLHLALTDEAGAVCELDIDSAVKVERSKETLLPAVKAVFDHAQDFVVGEALPSWQEGYLDIHSINGGRGESFFYIFPDGTTMLVDAAGGTPYEIQGEGGSGLSSKPSVDFTSGDVIIRYLKNYLPAVSNGKLDYFMLSHYHSDHMGSFTTSYSKYGWKAVDYNGNPASSIDLAKGGFLLNGLPEVGFTVPILTLIDRGEWNDRASNVWSSGVSRRQNYFNFIVWSKRTYGTVREKLEVGRTDQIVLKHRPEAYPGFSVRGIAANGNIWTGKGTDVNTSYVPSAAECLANESTWDINENIFSCVFTLSYGKFDMFSGGDIQYNDRGTYSWKDIEKPISKVVRKVEVMKACHHSTSTTNSSDLLNALRPDSFVIGVWTKNQPNPSTLKRVYAANPSVKIFATNLSGNAISNLSAAGIDASTFLARGGHVVVRVLPGGNEYYVLVLDDTGFTYAITEIHGPYPCQ